MAKDEWNDLFVRTDVRETSPADRKGGLGSPDVIPVGLNPTNPTAFTSEASYATYYNLPMQAGKPNYIYVRAKNSSSTGANKGQAFLVMSNPAIVLWPGGDGWTRIKTNNGNYYSQLDPAPTGKGAIAVTTDPFTFVPTESGHRCLVTWLSTTQHYQPDPPPKITTVEALAKFLIENPNYAHHNIDITPNTTGAVTQTQPFSSGTLDAKWLFGVRCVGAKGFTVSFTTGTPLPNGKYLTLEPTTVNQNSGITLTIDSVDVPPGWNTTFNYVYEQNGLAPPNFSVVFSAIYQPPLDHPLRPFCLTAVELGIPRDRVPSDFGGIEVGTIGVMRGQVGDLE